MKEGVINAKNSAVSGAKGMYKAAKEMNVKKVWPMIEVRTGTKERGG